MDRLTIDKINVLWNDFSREQEHLMRELREATSISKEKPIKDQLSAVDAMVRSLIRMRTIKRKEDENSV